MESNGNTYNQKGLVGIGNQSIGTVKGNAKVAGVIYEAKDQNLAEALAQVQQILQQLSQSYPTNTTTEQMIVATETIKKIENDPNLKQKLISAATSGGLAAFEKALDNPVGALVFGAIKGWQEAS
ncbi:MAG: hypothetical protein F6K40_14160 [Okeania sp. SIO3I5]|uniref:hypothetical protein n=1 Tax=Okeania sp. SIO3I5 TaxID=2607805 RepID=UPI0013B969DC|nr:hypothetical protein [Okeania sp. SIO3I5]NEQ37347.1 hypothetical protein [Okeania sp. SIO3I5]